MDLIQPEEPLAEDRNILLEPLVLGAGTLFDILCGEVSSS